MSTATIDHKVYTNSGNINVLNEIPKTANRILDIGCGAGDNSRILKSQGKIVDGVTISEAEANIAKEFQKNTYIFNLENGLPSEIPTNEFDVAIAAHVLEHICYPQNVMRDIHKSLKDNGLLIIALPNIMHYKTRLKILRGNFDYTENGIMDYTHFRWYTFTSAQQMLRDNGFEVVKAFVNSNSSNHPLLKMLPNGFENFLKSIAFAISKGFFGIELLYVARKK
jgi:2-polyprenyl-3-methyl-5-hydroxy-6-metoxy-1,4-benzoquinol methylase